MMMMMLMTETIRFVHEPVDTIVHQKQNTTHTPELINMNSISFSIFPTNNNIRISTIGLLRRHIFAVSDILARSQGMENRIQLSIKGKVSNNRKKYFYNPKELVAVSVPGNKCYITRRSHFIVKN